MKNDSLIKPLVITIPYKAMGNINSYVSWINQIKPLTALEEFELATRFRNNGDLDSARKLILANLKFVVHVANNYLGYGLSKADLIQEGTIGLMKAVKRFNPKRGIRLISFAIHWIKAEIHEYILKNWRIVKIATTKAQRKLFFNLRRISKKFNWFVNDEILDISKNLNVSARDVTVMESRLNGTDIAFDMSSDDSDENNPSYYLESDSKNPADEIADNEFENLKSKKLIETISELDERSKDILNSRWLIDGEKKSLNELAVKYRISAERVRQIEESAIKKIKKSFSKINDFQHLIK